MKYIKEGTEFLDRLKDKLHEQKWEIENLKKRLEDIETFINNCDKSNFSDEERAILETIILIKKGTIKVVK